MGRISAIMVVFVMKIAALTLLATATLFAASRHDEPAPKPDDGSFDLAVNMRFLEEKLNLNGHVNYVANFHDKKTGEDGSNSFSSEISRVRAAAGTCRIDLHDTESRDGELIFDKDFWIDLRTVQEVVVIPREQAIRTAAEAQGNLDYSFRVDPPIFVLVARRADGESDFYFRSELFANRVAKAFTRAVELCRGRKKGAAPPLPATTAGF